MVEMLREVAAMRTELVCKKIWWTACAAYTTQPPAQYLDCWALLRCCCCSIKALSCICWTDQSSWAEQAVRHIVQVYCMLNPTIRKRQRAVRVLCRWMLRKLSQQIIQTRGCRSRE
jgi:hypothetical protein